MNAPKIINALSRLGVLGNAVTREYDIGRETGQVGLWKIHTATKKTTGQRVSVFLFDKKYFDSPMHQFSALEREKICELLKREAMQLTRLRHPSILEVVESVDESRSVIAFATEPLMATLGDIIHRRRRNQVSEDGEPYELDELEIQKGLIQVAKGLQFCHQDAHLVHGNLHPEAVFINVKGDWKLGGFGFSTFTNRPAGTTNELSVFKLEEILPDICVPNRDYMAPERAFDCRIDFAGDMFALGSLIHAIYYKGEPPARAGRSDSVHRAAIDAIEQKSFEQIPATLRPMVHQMLHRDAEKRPNAATFQQCSYFDNLLVSTIRFLETFCEKTRDQKIQFLKGLPRILPEFPDRVLKKKVLLLLLEEIKDHSLLPLVLPNVLYIAEKTSSIDFTNRILPSLKPLFSIKEPAPAVIALLDKTTVLQKKTSASVFKEDVLPLVINALDSTIPTVQERALKVIPSISEALDYTIVKNSIFPKTQTLFCTTNVLSVKVNTLICFHAMLKTLDKFTIVERLLPTLRKANSREPAVIMASLVIYDEIGRNQLEKEHIASEILPELWRLCMDPGLNLTQFKKFMKTIRDLSEKVEEQQTKHLSEMKRLNEPTSSDAAAGASAAGTSHEEVTRDDFQQLVSGGTSTVVEPSVQPSPTSKTSLPSTIPAAKPSANILNTTDVFASLVSTKNETFTSTTNGTTSTTTTSNDIFGDFTAASIAPAMTTNISTPVLTPNQISPITTPKNTTKSLSPMSAPILPAPPSTTSISSTTTSSSTGMDNVFTSLPTSSLNRRSMPLSQPAASTVSNLANIMSANTPPLVPTTKPLGFSTIAGTSTMTPLVPNSFGTSMTPLVPTSTTITTSPTNSAPTSRKNQDLSSFDPFS